MANINGAQNALPGVYSTSTTIGSGVSVPGGSRVTAMIGEGLANEIVVPSAQGNGLDGLNISYSSTSGSDGRHFQLQNFPLISNRTTVFKNGIPLVGIEMPLNNTDPSFSSSYDYAIDITQGRLALQTAHLVDQGGTNYVPLSTNVGDGYLSALSLVDKNAPAEIWTIRCVSVQRNAMNQPVAGTATFLAIGSVSGSLLDANGNPIRWVANGQVVSNGILSFAISEATVMSVAVSPFVQGDGFTIKTYSGVLNRGDSLTTTEIPVANLNNPTLTQGIGAVVNQFGSPAVTNPLSLGAQLFYANGASSLIALQAAPSLPRRTSYVLDPAVNSLSTNDDDFIFPFPLGVEPDLDSDVHFFVTDPTTNVETQLLPNKFPYFTLGTVGQPTNDQFIQSNLQPPAGWSFSYSVIQSLEDLVTGFDGYIARDPAFNNRGIFSSSITYDASYVGTTLKIIDSANVANIGTFTVTAVSSGKLYATGPTTFGDFTTQSGTSFELIDTTTGLVVAGSPGTDGSLVNLIGTGHATLTSTAVTWSGFAGLLTTLKLKITGSAHNNGLYDILGNNTGTNTLTIAKAIVSETNLRFEVLNTAAVSNFLVVNKNVVPNGNQLRVTIVDSRDASFYDAGWENAYAALETIECDIVVPLPLQTISVIFQNGVNHVKDMSNVVNRKERVLFIGAIAGLTPDNLSGAKLAAVENIGILEGIQGNTVTEILAGNIEDLANYSVSNAYGDTYRVVYFYPDQIVVQAGSDNVLIDGFYIAAAAAGYESADIILQNPITNKVFSGFTILSNKMYSNATLQTLAAAGVTTLQPVAGGGKVVWGITTSQSGFPEEQEISVVFIRDRVAKVLRAGFSGFIGTPQTVDTGAVLNTEAVVLLNSLVSQGLIIAYRNLSVSQDTVDPRQYDISVEISPAEPLNWVYLSIGVGSFSSIS
jgi:hypothetical protein